MDTPPSPPVATDPRLLTWLETATAGLSEEARERVRGEIVDHVTESVAERRAAGAGPDEALVAAVAALGDAPRAARALRRANLSRSEARVVGGLARPLPLWAFALYLLGIPAFTLVTLLEEPPVSHPVIVPLSYLGIVAGIAAMFFLARSLARKGRLRGALIADVFGRWLYFASLVVGSRLVTSGTSRLDFVIYGGAFAAGLLLVARVWPKVGRYRPRTG